MKKLILRSIGASLFIGLGVYILLTLNNPLGAILFSFGLLGICVLKLNLFTGKCGFIMTDKVTWKELGIILITNLIFGYIFGLIFSFTNTELISIALLKISTWSISLSYLLKSMLCGSIMYIAVKMYEETKIGILYGIPLFILCGFQHCIANVIILGIANTFSPALFVCIIGNFLGSLITYYVTK